MTLLLVAFLRAHWLKLAIAAAAFGAGWFLHRPSQPTVDAKQTATASASSATAKDEHKAQGPVDFQIDVGGCAPPALGHRSAPMTVPDSFPGTALDGMTLPAGTRITVHEGPSTDDVHETAQTSSSEVSTLDLHIAPAEKHYSLILGAQVLPERHPLIGGAVRVGPAWLQLEAVPDFAAPLRSSVFGSVRFDF